MLLFFLLKTSIWGGTITMSSEDVWMVNKIVKICLMVLNIKKMQPETLKNHYIPARTAEIKIQYQVLKNVEQIKHSYIARGNV